MADPASTGGVSRRALLRGLSAAAAGALPLSQLVATLAHAAAPGGRASVRPLVGVQLYTVRALMARDPDGTLAALEAAGVREVEFAGYFDRTPEALRTLLDRYGLTAPAAHVPLPARPVEWSRVFDAAEALGHKWLVIPWVAPDVRASLDGWRRFADLLNDAGMRASSRALRLAYHHHDFEFAITDGAMAYDVIMDRLDASLVDLELDPYWAVKAGQDPQRMLADRPGRFPLCHLTDAGPAPRGTMVEVGAGTIDLAALLATGAQTGLRHAFIKCDNPSDPMASVRASVSVLRCLLLDHPGLED
jgi:sugar phosphate isomerase/epimerase